MSAMQGNDARAQAETLWPSKPGAFQVLMRKLGAGERLTREELDDLSGMYLNYATRTHTAVAALVAAENERDEWSELAGRDIVVALKRADAAEARAAALETALTRAAYIAEHLLQQVPEFTGVIGPGGQREDDYIAASLYEEIKGWAALAASPAARDSSETSGE